MGVRFFNREDEVLHGECVGLSRLCEQSLFVMGCKPFGVLGK